MKKALVDPEANAKEPWDEREEKHDLKRISAVPEEFIERIKEIAKTGPLFCCADDASQPFGG